MENIGGLNEWITLATPVTGGDDVVLVATPDEDDEDNEDDVWPLLAGHLTGPITNQ